MLLVVFTPLLSQELSWKTHLLYNLSARRVMINGRTQTRLFQVGFGVFCWFFLPSNDSEAGVEARPSCSCRVTSQWHCCPCPPCSSRCLTLPVNAFPVWMKQCFEAGARQIGPWGGQGCVAALVCIIQAAASKRPGPPIPTAAGLGERRLSLGTGIHLGPCIIKPRLGLFSVYFGI